MAKENIEISGLSELLRRLQQLDQKVQNEISARAVEDGGQIVLDSARHHCPIDTGALRRSIHMIVRKNRKGYAAIIQTGTRAELGISSDDPSYYPAAIEFGTEERRTKSGKSVGAITPPTPYMRPAFDNNVRKSIGAIADTLGRRIEAAATSG